MLPGRKTEQKEARKKAGFFLEAPRAGRQQEECWRIFLKGARGEKTAVCASSVGGSHALWKTGVRHGAAHSRCGSWLRT